MRQGLLHGMPRSELRLLPDHDEIGGGDRLRHLLAAVAVDDADALGIQGAGGGDHVREHGPPRERMQHLGQARMHALALAGREYHHIGSGAHREIIAQTSAYTGGARVGRAPPDSPSCPAPQMKK